MEKRLKVVFCGGSLIMAGLEASLHDEEGLETMLLEANFSVAGDRILSLEPHAIVLDLDEVEWGLAVPLLWNHPGILMIALDLSTSTAMVLSCRRYLMSSLSDLSVLVQNQRLALADESELLADKLAGS